MKCYHTGHFLPNRPTKGIGCYGNHESNPPQLTKDFFQRTVKCSAEAD